MHYRYDAFGNLVSGDPELTRYLFTAREYDATTDLQYNRKRWYDPATGRWLSEDPIGFGGGDYNLSRYVGNGPTNAIDPEGTQFIGPKFMSDEEWAKMSEEERQDYAETLNSRMFGMAIPVSPGGVGGLFSWIRNLFRRTPPAIAPAGQLADDCAKPLVNLTNKEILKAMGTGQKQLLADWMGLGAKGAQEALKKPLPAGLTADTLRKYLEIAKRMVAQGNDKVGTQAARIKSIEEALRKVGQ